MCHFMIINEQSNQSHILDPEAERILEDRSYRDEMEFLIAQELPLPQIDRHIPEENWDSTLLERNGPSLALGIPVCIMPVFFIPNKFYNNHQTNNPVIDLERHPQVIIMVNEVFDCLLDQSPTNLARFDFLLGVQQ